MLIKIEDYYGNDLCQFNVNTLKNLSEIKNLKQCNIADIDLDENEEEYIRVQIDTI